MKLGGDYVYTVNVHAPRFWLWRIGQWLPVAWENVVDRGVSVGDVLAPKECIWIEDGKDPAEVWEQVIQARQSEEAKRSGNG